MKNNVHLCIKYIEEAANLVGQLLTNFKKLEKLIVPHLDFVTPRRVLTNFHFPTFIFILATCNYYQIGGFIVLESLELQFLPHFR